MFIFGMLIISASLFSQQRARQGLSTGDHTVSGTNIKVVDSTTSENDVMKHFVNGVEQTIFPPESSRSNLEDISAELDAIYVQDSMKNKDGKIAHYIESTQYYPAIEEQTNAIRAIQDAGGTLQAICTWCDLIPLNTLAIVNQRILFSNIYIPESATDLTGIYWVQTVTGAYTADNNNKVGLYSVDGDSIRLIASSANDGDLWKAADSTFQYKAFSSAYSDPEPGVYYTAFIYCISGSTTAPQLGARYNAISGLNARALIGNNHFSSGYLDNQTDFPTAIALADISQLTGIYWSGVY